MADENTAVSTQESQATEPQVKHEKSAPVVTKKTKKKAKKTAKKVSAAKEKKTIEREEKTTGLPSWLIVVIVVLVVGLLSFGIYSIAGKNQSNTVVVNNNVNVNNNNNTSTNLNNLTIIPGIALTIVEDPSCKTCQVDLFAAQVEKNLFPGMTTTKVDFNSELGKAVVKTTNANFVPLYLFSTEVAQHPKWKEGLSDAFAPITVNGKSYYLLNPMLVDKKALVNDFVIPKDAVIVGNKSAKLTIIEFSDFECPFCAIAEGNPELLAEFQKQQKDYVAPMPNVYKNYIDSGKAKLVFINTPIEQLHPKSKEAHLAAMCANEQGKWEEYANTLFMKRSEWQSLSDRTAKFNDYAKSLKLDEAKFSSCLSTKKYESQIDADLKLAAEYGVQGTPSFIIGKNFISGAQDYYVFDTLLKLQQ